MSVESIAIALHHSRATGTAKLVLVGIANHDGDGGAWPSVATLAKYAGTTTRNVQKAIARLEQLGEIERRVNQGGTFTTPDHARPNLYRFIIACPNTCDGSKNHKTRVAMVAIEQGVSHPTGGVASDRGGVSVATPEPSINQPSTVKETTRLIAREAEPVDNSTECLTYGHRRGSDGTSCIRCNAALHTQGNAS